VNTTCWPPADELQPKQFRFNVEAIVPQRDGRFQHFGGLMNAISRAKLVAVALAAAMSGCGDQKTVTAPEQPKTTAAAPKAGVDAATLEACGLTSVDYDFRGLKDRLLVGKAETTERGAVFARRVLHVNTDGAPNSYHSRVIAADDRQIGALNLICNAVVQIRPVSWGEWLPTWFPGYSKPKPIRCYGERGIKVDANYARIYEAIRANDWQPAEGHRIEFNWDILGRAPMPETWPNSMFGTERPCVDKDGFFTSMTKLRNGGQDSCDQRAHLDANEIPALVLPKHWFADWSSKTVGRWGSFKDGDVVVAYRPATATAPELFVPAIVGDAGPIGRLGEASIAMNWQLKREQGDIRQRVRTYLDVLKLDTGSLNPKEVPFLVLEDTAKALQKKYTPELIRDVATKVFRDWGGEARFKACLAAL
jgi:hypothetical protein